MPSKIGQRGFHSRGAGAAVFHAVERRIPNERPFDPPCRDAAVADPDHDWRIFKFAPLYDAVYQRHAAGQWVLIERGEGFA